MPHLAIIGAGVAGLAAGRRLRRLRPDLAITIYEKGSRPGGRVATRRRGGFVFDHGAQIFKAPTGELQQLIDAELPGEGLRAIAAPVWVFDAHGTVAPGDPLLNAESKWVYAEGINRLAELLAGGLDVRREAPVARLSQQQVPTTDSLPVSSVPHPSAYTLFDPAGYLLGEADAVLITAPAPQAAAILHASEIDPHVSARLAAGLDRATYRCCLSLAVAYDQPIERPFYALVNIDRAHPIAWLALEHTKGPERCPPGQSLLVLQMAPQFSREHWDAPVEQAAARAAAYAGALLGATLRQPLWADREGWPYALPDASADFAALNSTGSRLFFAGDYTAMPGRVHLAIESGWRAAEIIAREVR